MPPPWSLITPGNLAFESSNQLCSDVSWEPQATCLPVPLAEYPTLDVAPIPTSPLRLLHGLGKVTASPSGIGPTLLDLVGWWPILRYAWAFDDPCKPDDLLRLSAITDGVRGHRRSLFSEDFGIAATAFVLEELVGATDILDADEYLDALTMNGGPLLHTGPRRPDYLVRPAPGDPWIVVDAKGNSHGRGALVKQLADGCAQVSSVSSVVGPVRRLVIGAVAPRDSHKLLSGAIEIPRTAARMTTTERPPSYDVLAADLGRAQRLAYAGAFMAASRRGRRKLLSDEPRRRRVTADHGNYEGLTFVVDGGNWQVEAFFGLAEPLMRAYEEAPIEAVEQTADSLDVVESQFRSESIAIRGRDRGDTSRRREVPNQYVERRFDERGIESICADGTVLRLIISGFPDEGR